MATTWLLFSLVIATKNQNENIAQLMYDTEVKHRSFNYQPIIHMIYALFL